LPGSPRRPRAGRGARRLAALAVTLAGFVGSRELFALWLRLHYMTPVTVYYKLTASPPPNGSYLSVSQGIVGANGQLPAGSLSTYYLNGLQVPAGGQTCMVGTSLQSAASCLAAHGYQGYLTYQPASRFWAFQSLIGITAITRWLIVDISMPFAFR
jgi:hypothetical protein